MSANYAEIKKIGEIELYSDSINKISIIKRVFPGDIIIAPLIHRSKYLMYICQARFYDNVYNTWLACKLNNGNPPPVEELRDYPITNLNSQKMFRYMVYKEW